MRWLLTLLLVATWLPNSSAAVRTSPVNYTHENKELEGYLAYDDSVTGPRPGILLIHDWWGIGQFEKQRAEQLAEAGFAVFVADLYGKDAHPADETEAIRKEATGRDNIQSLRAHAQAGLDQLKLSPLVDPEKISAIGYSFGGGAALELARSGAGLKGIIIFYARFNTQYTDDDKNIKGKLLLLQGAADPFVPWRQLQAFKEELERSAVDYRMVIYGKAKHNFANQFDPPSRGSGYNAEADTYSMNEVRLFLREVFSG